MHHHIEETIMDERRRQEIFDTAYKGLAAQGFVRSQDSGGNCMYRGGGGRKCAIGHLIPDEKYRHELEDLTPSSESVRTAAGLIKADEQFAYNLQVAHDSDYGGDASDTPADMKDRLAEFAEQYGLTIPQVDA
jgi:hypothetical protein